MNIPRFWSSSDPQKPFICWHWSDISVEDARQGAEEKSQQLARRFAANETLDRYAYGNGAIREEIVQTIPGDGDELLAVITRNVYGSLVLNTRSAMFIDIDFPPMPKRSVFGGLFGKRVPQDDGQQAAIDKLDASAAQHPALGLRVYRTFAGLRCLVTSQTFDPTDEQTIALLQSAGSDPLYIRLCQAQACFRARLTPKPWRSGATVPPSRYPFSTEQQAEKHRKWQAEYERAIAGFSVCRLIKQIGAGRVLREIQPVLALHDQMTATTSNRPLA